MSVFISIQPIAGRYIFRLGAPLSQNAHISNAQVPFLSAFARCVSGSSKPKGGARRLPSTNQKQSEAASQNRRADASRKATTLLHRLSKLKKPAPQNKPQALPRDRIIPAAIKINTQENASKAEVVEQKTIEMDEKEEAIQRRIVKERVKLLWPGIWTVFAVASTYCTFAYLDAKYNQTTTIDTAPLPDRMQLPQSWFLTTKVIKEGLQAGWVELDKLTVGIVVASFAVHLMKRSRIPFWEHLIHITGEKKYTAFTYAFVHSNWPHIGQNMFALCWFLPGVVHYFNGDLFHTAAFLISVPLITSYLQHFAFRWSLMKGIALNMGSSGAIAAVFGAFCTVYPDEKVWMPSFVILRLDAKYWGLLFAFWQVAALVNPRRGGNRSAVIVSFLEALTSEY